MSVCEGDGWRSGGVTERNALFLNGRHGEGMLNLACEDCLLFGDEGIGIGESSWQDRALREGVVVDV